MSNNRDSESELSGIEALWARRPDIKRYWQASVDYDTTVCFRVSSLDPDIKMIVMFLPLTRKGKWWVLE